MTANLLLAIASSWVKILYLGVPKSNPLCHVLVQNQRIKPEALANAYVELVWIQTLLNELQISTPCAPTLFCDNIGATYLTSNPIYHARTKHIEIDYHFVRDQVTDKLLNVRFISGKDHIVNALTKPLPASRFLHLASNLNVRPLTSSLRGRIRLDKSLSSDKD